MTLEAHRDSGPQQSDVPPAQESRAPAAFPAPFGAELKATFRAGEVQQHQGMIRPKNLIVLENPSVTGGGTHWLRSACAIAASARCSNRPDGWLARVMPH
jgi:hypothetical protein